MTELCEVDTQVPKGRPLSISQMVSQGYEKLPLEELLTNISVIIDLNTVHYFLGLKSKAVWGRALHRSQFSNRLKYCKYRKGF